MVMHKEMRLFVTKRAYVFAPETGPNLAINRETSEMSLMDSPPPVSEQDRTLAVAGIMGLVTLQAGDYLIVITGRECIGNIRGHEVFRITAFQILPLPESLAGLSEAQAKDEQTYVDLLEAHLRETTFYYSPTYDLTHTLQRQAQFTTETLSEPLWKRADERFFWNKEPLNRLIEATLSGNPTKNFSDFILPVLQGFVELQTTEINNKPFVLALITRRSRHRAGTRFFSRGIDKHGHVSNFVETEQLVLYDGPGSVSPSPGLKQLSYVQTRGSIPVYWTQVINLKYTPRLWVGENRKSLAAARSHFDEQIRIYGPQILINLINKKGYELPMGQAYARTVEQLNDPRLHYTHFDFHNECKNMRWDRINVLVDQLKEQLDQQGYMYYDASNKDAPTIRKKQTSVIRSNCMDCLDRTNVVQSTFAKVVLNAQLREIGILGANESVDDHQNFILIFRNVWADNADAVSTVYSGTGALKTDFTRTGKRTVPGALQDLSNSITRYCKNNFMDGKRMDAFDLFLGHYHVKPLATVEKYQSPFVAEKPLRIRVVPYILIFSLFMLLLNIFRPDYSGFEYRKTYFLWLSFWFSVVVTASRFSLRHGDQFVEWPHLVELSPCEDNAEEGVVESKGNMVPPEMGLDASVL
ncbi:SacI homology domain-containing protein [Phycomyces nitens]|nr:SacI homology domain-containing protein [Phycomyces nitens]